MGRIKFGGDDEEEQEAKKVEEEQEESTAPLRETETVKFDQNDDESEVRIGKRTSRLCMFLILQISRT